jgi:hypothetical protein
MNSNTKTLSNHIECFYVYYVYWLCPRVYFREYADNSVIADIGDNGPPPPGR